MGWSLSPVNDRHLTLAALKRALVQRCPGEDLLTTPTRAAPTRGEVYQDVLEKHGITCSMSRRGEVLDNAPMESWNSTFKFECGERFDTNEITEAKTFDYIEVFYNRQRRHSAIGYVSPRRVRESRASGGGRPSEPCLHAAGG